MCKTTKLQKSTKQSRQLPILEYLLSLSLHPFDKNKVISLKWGEFSGVVREWEVIMKIRAKII